MPTEYRVVNVNAPGLKWNPFKCFGEDLGRARKFLEEETFACEGIGHRLESRPVDGGPEDWKEIEFWDAERCEANRRRIKEEMDRRAKEAYAAK